MAFVAWALESGHTQVSAPLVPEPAPNKPVLRYWGAERDSEMGAVAQLALQFDAERSPVIEVRHSWGEWLRDPVDCYGVNRDVVPAGYPLYRGCEGNSFTYGGYAKPTYNVMRMLGMQAELRLPVTISSEESPRQRDRVGAIVTRDPAGRRVVVLLWYYVAPEDLQSAAGRRYEDLRDFANANLRRDVQVALDGLGPGPYRLERYVVGRNPLQRLTTTARPSPTPRPLPTRPTPGCPRTTPWERR